MGWRRCAGCWHEGEPPGRCARRAGARPSGVDGRAADRGGPSGAGLGSPIGHERPWGGLVTFLRLCGVLIGHERPWGGLVTFLRLCGVLIARATAGRAPRTKAAGKAIPR